MNELASNERRLYGSGLLTRLRLLLRTSEVGLKPIFAANGQNGGSGIKIASGVRRLRLRRRIARGAYSGYARPKESGGHDKHADSYGEDRTEVFPVRPKGTRL